MADTGGRKSLQNYFREAAWKFPRSLAERGLAQTSSIGIPAHRHSTPEEKKTREKYDCISLASGTSYPLRTCVSTSQQPFAPNVCFTTLTACATLLLTCRGGLSLFMLTRLQKTQRVNSFGHTGMTSSTLGHLDSADDVVLIILCVAFFFKSYQLGNIDILFYMKKIQGSCSVRCV